MIKTILLIIFILSFINVTDAQWYQRKCGVSDLNNCTAEEFECLWNKAEKTIRVGAITTGLGAAGFGGGIVLVAMVFSGYWGETWAWIGMAVSWAGIISCVLVGPPIWITGASRKSNLRKTLQYEQFKLGTLKLSPSIGLNQFNNTYNYGVTLSFTF